MGELLRHGVVDLPLMNGLELPDSSTGSTPAWSRRSLLRVAVVVPVAAALAACGADGGSTTAEVAGDAGASAADGAPALEDVTVEVWRDPG